MCSNVFEYKLFNTCNLFGGVDFLLYNPKRSYRVNSIQKQFWNKLEFVYGIPSHPLVVHDSNGVYLPQHQV